MKDKILATFLLACASLLFLTAVTRSNFKRTLYESNKSQEALVTLKSVAQVLDNLPHYETSYRGYLRTGDEQFLESYLNIIAHYKTNVEELNRINLTDSTHQNLIDQLVLQIEKKIIYDQGIVNSFVKNGKRVLAGDINEEEGKILLDNIRDLVIQIKAKEGASLKQYEDVNKENAENTLVLFYSFSGVMLLLLLILYIYIDKEVEEKESAKKKLSDFNASLEQRIRERTAQLNKTERRFRALIENSLDGVCLVNESREIIYQSPSTEVITGFSPDERIQENFFDFAHPDDVQKCKTLFEEIIQNPGTSIEFQARTLHKKNYYINIDGTASNLLNDHDIGAIVVNYRDITEKLKAQNEVKKIADQLTEISSSIPGVVYQFKLSADASMSFTYVSNGMLELTGLTYEQIYNDIGLVFSKVAEEDLKGLMDSITSSAQNLQPWFYVFRVERSKEDVRWIRGSAIPNLLPNGDTVWNGTMIDITDLKNTEQQLIESEQRYRSVIEQASDVIMITDNKGNFTDVNSVLCKKFGYSKAELLHMTIHQLIDQEQLKNDPIRFDLLAQGVSILRERRMTKKTGEVVDVEVNVKMLPDGRILAIARDITERKRAALALQNSENRLRTILDTEPECVKLLDSKGNLMDMNRSGLAMIEVEDIQMVKGKSVIMFVDPEYRTGFKELIAGVFRGESCKMSYAITGLKGTKRFVESHSVPMHSEAGEITALLSVTRDVTEKIKAEQEMAKMNSQLRELSTHLQTVAEEERASIAREIHDELGQQLTGLKMDVTWMLRKTTEDEAGLKRKLVDVNLLIDELIKSVRRIAADLRPGALDDLGLVAALEWYSNVFEKRTGIKCKILSEFPDHAFPKDLSIAVYRIYQEALTNVARHAKATSVNSTLYIKDQDLFLSVQDNGKGIDEAEVSQKSTLGLAGMKERARMLHGEVSINKVNTGGTEVKLKIHLNE